MIILYDIIAILYSTIISTLDESGSNKKFIQIQQFICMTGNVNINDIKLSIGLYEIN